MNKTCARCEKTVYPTEELKCLDKVWHKGCFKCQECGMTLNMRTYKGYGKLPYCESHVPKAKHTTMAETPELKRIAENTKIQSNVTYHAAFEKAKGKFTQVADDPETLRIKANTRIISNVAYHGDLEKKAQMEKQRTLNENGELVDPPPDNYQQLQQLENYATEMLAPASPPPALPTKNHYQTPPNQSYQTPLNQSYQNTQEQQYRQDYYTQYPPNSNAQSYPTAHNTQNYQATTQKDYNNSQSYPNTQREHNTQRDYQSTQREYQSAQKDYHATQKDYQSTQKEYQSTQKEYQSTQKDYHATQKEYQSTQKDYQSTQKDYQPTQKDYQHYGYGQPYYGGVPAHQSQQKIGKIHDYDPLSDGPRAIPETHRPAATLVYNSTGDKRGYSGAAQQASTQQQTGRSIGRVSDLDPLVAENASSGQPQRAPLPSTHAHLNGRVYVAMYDYEANDSDEVSFREGDLISNVSAIDEGWMTGKVVRTGHTGMLPANYVELARI